MFVTLWEFEVKPGFEERFETVYSPAGHWAAFFRRDPAYRGTRLLRDITRPQTYLTLDIWESRSAYERFREGQRREYQRLDAECEALTASETPLGSFETGG